MQCRTSKETGPVHGVSRAEPVFCFLACFEIQAEKLFPEQGRPYTPARITQLKKQSRRDKPGGSKTGKTKTSQNLSVLRGFSGGKMGIRTPERFYTLHDFQSCALDQLSHLSTYSFVFAALCFRVSRALHYNT